MAPVETRSIEFPVRKLRTRSTKPKVMENQDQPNTDYNISKSPLKQVKSPKPSPLKSATSTTNSRSTTPHRVALHFKEDNQENSNPNASEKLSTKVLSSKMLEKCSPATTTPTKIKISQINKSPTKPMQILTTPLVSPVKKLLLTSPRKAELTSNRILRSPQKKSISTTSDTEDELENTTPNVPLIKRSPRKMVKVREPSIFRADVTQFVEARRALSTALPPDSAGLIGRQKQLGLLKEFLLRNLGSSQQNKGKRSIYISGPPGTGKTTCLKHLMKSLQNNKEFKDKNNVKGSSIEEPHCIFVNSMSVKSSAAIYAKIAEEILPMVGSMDAGNSVESHKKVLEDTITGQKLNKKVLLVLDEIDQLDSKCHDVLYSLFEWPYLRNSKVVLVGIANSLDLTDRILPRLKLRENICPEQMTFAAYSKKEISSIICSRLEGMSMPSEQVIKPAAINFLSAKISALTGDVRKALDVCRRAIEVAESESRKQTLLSKPLLQSPGMNATVGNFKPIDIPQIMKIINEVYCSSAATASLKETNSDLPLQQKILIASLLLMTNYGKRPIKEVTAAKLHETYTKLCKKRGMSAVNLTEALSLCSLLEARGIFSVRKVLGKKLSNSDIKISLRIDDEEVQAALKDKTLLSGILKDTDCICK